MAPRPSYKTFVIEREVAAPRQVVWDALVDMLERVAPGASTGEVAFTIGDYDLVERTLSFEPPWRRAYEIVQGAPAKLYQGTITVRDDGPSCLLVWSYLCEANDDGSTDAFLEKVQGSLTRAADGLARAALSR